MNISQREARNTTNKKELSQILVEHIIPDFLMLWVVGIFIVSGKLYEYLYNTAYYILSQVNKESITIAETFTKTVMIVLVILIIIDALRIAINSMYIVFPAFYYKENKPRLARKVIKEYEEQ